jgi:hypothetical protein
MTKYLIWVLAFILLLDCAATIGLYLSVKNEPLEREDYQMFKAVKIPEDTVYVDPMTIGTTTDPTDAGLN